MIFANEIGGGVLIGLASAIPLLWEGRVAGVSGYLATSLRPQTADAKTALLFVVGLVGGAFAWRALGFSLPPNAGSELGTALGAVAGLLVGFGSRLAGGCTSGHGVCGLGRLSPRSLVSVLIFMGFAIATQLLLRGLK